MAQELEILLKVQEQNTEAIGKVNSQIRELEPATASASSGMAVMAGAAAAAAVVVAGLGLAFAKSLESLLGYAESLEKANLQTGLSIDFIQKLAKTGDEMHISFDQTRGAVERMEKALEGNGAALAKFGISVAAFQGLNADEKFRAMAVQIMAIQDPTERTAAAMAVFGRSGAELIPILAAIVSGSVDAQRALGKDTLEALGKTDEGLDHLKTAWKTLTQEVVAAVATNVPLALWFNLVAEGIRHMEDGLRAVGGQWVGLITTLATGSAAEGAAAGAMFTYIGHEAQQSAPRVSASVLAMTESTRQLRIALDELTKMWDDEAKAAEAAGKKSEAAWLKANQEIAADLAARTREHQRRYQEDTDSALKEVERQLAAQRRLAAETEKQNRDAVAEARKKWNDMARAADAYFDALDTSARRNHSARVTELRVEAAEAETAYRRMREAGVATFEELRAAHERMSEANKKVREEEQKAQILSFENLAHTASGILRDLFGKHKAAAIAAAIIDTIAAIVKTMASYPWPWSLIPAAAAAVAGYAEVQKIRSQEAGFAQGTPGTSFVDFGPATPTVLHGPEAVVTPAQGQSLADMIRGALQDGGRASGAAAAAWAGESSQPIIINIGGEQFARFLLRRSRTGHMLVDSAGVTRRG